MPFSPEEIEYNRRIQNEQLRQRQQAEAQAPAEPEVPDPVSPAGDPSATPEEVALGVKDEQGKYQPTENTAQQGEREEGLVTQIGNAIGYVVGPDLTSDALNAGAAALNMVSGGNLQGLDDFIQSSGEQQETQERIAEDRQKRRDEGKMSGVEKALHTTANTMEGLASGMESGIALPFTIAARLTNSAAPWSDPPETLKNSPIGKTVHAIAEILTPTVLTGGVAGSLGYGGFGTGVVGLNIESFIETAQQDSFEDLIAGRTLAAKFGEVADTLGLDGAQLTRELIEGKTVPSQIYTAVVGHIQNLTINFGFNQVYKKIHGRLPEPSPDQQKAAKALGKTPEEVQLELDFVNAPKYSALAEPHEGTDIDTGVVSIWHGTTQGRMKAIQDKGFKPSNRSFNIMGEGVYFSTDSRYASQYGDYYIGGNTRGLNVLDLEGKNVSDWAEEIGIGRPSDLTDWEGQPVSKTVYDSLDPDDRAAYFTDEQKLALEAWAKDNGVDGIRYNAVFEENLEGAVDELVIFDPAKASKAAGIGGINPVAFTAEALRQADIAEDGLTAANREYFTNWKAVADTESMAAALKLATNTLKKLKENKSDLAAFTMRAKAGWDQIKAALDLDDYGTAAKLYRKNFTRPLGEIPERLAKKEIDTRGDGNYFHGSATEIKELGEGFYETQNIYGQGFYVTDDFTTASSYTKKNRKSANKAGQEVAQRVYQVRETTPVRFFDLDASGIPNEVNALLDDAAGYNPAVDAALGEIDDATTLGEAMDLIRDYSRSTGTSADVIQETFESIREVLGKQGYGGFTHTGGVLTKNKRKHNVRIYWEPKEQITIDEVPESFSRYTGASEIPDEAYLREFSEVGKDGFMAAGAIAEELGVRMKKAAMVADNLEGIGVDFSKAVENLLELHDKAGLFLTPFRRGKRRTSLEFTGQQRKQTAKMKDADIQDQLSTEPLINIDSSYRDLDAFQVKGVDGADRNTIRELWEMYKGGDSVAGQTLKAYINIVAYSDPRTVLTNVVDLTSVATEALKSGTQDAFRTLIYAARLSRIGTQVTANFNTTLLQVMDSVGNIMSGIGPGMRGDWSETAYGFGKLLGGFDGVMDGLAATRRSFKENQTFVKPGGQRFDHDVKNLKQKQKILEENYANVRKRLNETNAPISEKLNAATHFFIQTAANRPGVSVGARALMAADEGHTVINGAAIAKGRAFQEAMQTGTFGDPNEVKRLIQVHTKKIFDEAKRTGKILDGEVLQHSRKLTFTDGIAAIGEELPNTRKRHVLGREVDRLFLSMEQAAKDSVLANIATPFTRVTYESLDAFARFEPSGAFRSLHPRYKAILEGKYGETARLQLRSNIASGWLTTASFAFMAYNDMVTGDYGPIKRSIIIPSPLADKGYIAISYAKLEPFATIIAATSDAVRGFRDEVLTFGDYGKFMQLMIASLGISTLDKQFTQGFQKVIDFFDVSRIKAMGEGAAASAAGMAGVPWPRIVDQIADTIQPYQTISSAETPLWAFFTTFIKQNIGGVGLPHDYDEFTGEKIPKAATLGDGENLAAAQAAQVLRELMWAGNVTNADKTHPIKKKLTELGYEPKRIRFYDRIDGVDLSGQETSDLKRGMHEYGQLSASLDQYFKSNEFKNDFNNLQKFRKNQSTLLGLPIGHAGEGDGARILRDRIFKAIDTRFKAARERSARAVLYPQPGFYDKYQQIQVNKLIQAQ